MPLQAFWEIISKTDFKTFTEADVKTSTVISLLATNPTK